MEAITALKDTPIPNVLVLGGLAFLLLAVAGQVAGKIDVPPARQKWAALIGTLLLVSGVILYLIPSSPPSPNTIASAKSPPTPAVPTGIPTSIPAVDSSTAMPTPQPTAILSGDCFAQYFSGIPSDRVRTIEMGTIAFEVLRPDQPKNGVIGIKFTEFNRPIGAMKFHFIPDSSIFRIEAVVGASCEVIENYANEGRGGDKRVLQNWDTLQVQLGDHKYAVRFGHSAGQIRASTRQASS